MVFFSDSSSHTISSAGDWIVLQVRLNSTRLPKKLLLPLAGKSIFEHILIRLLHAKRPAGVIIATTAVTIPSIKDVVSKYSVRVFEGPEEDVLERYIRVIRTYRLTHVIRPTGENPLACIEYIDKAVALHHKENADLTTYPDLPYGTGIEVIRAEALELAGRLAKEPFEREHITQYIYRHDEQFKIVRGVPDDIYRNPEVRLTVDTTADYEKMKNIYNTLWNGKPILVHDVLAYIAMQEK